MTRRAHIQAPTPPVPSTSAGLRSDFLSGIVQRAVAGPAQSLDAGNRSSMEALFGHSFADVKVHAGTHAAEAAQRLSARAFTVGPDIVFGQGQYSPHSRTGRHLLAHELAHVVQQAGPSDAIHVRPARDDLVEAEAERSAAAVIGGTPMPRLTPDRPWPHLSRAPLPGQAPTARAAPGCQPADKAPVAGAELRFGFDAVKLAPGQELVWGDILADAQLSSTVQIHGYASEDGSPEYNMELSCRRAEAVRDMMRSARVTAAIEVVAHGETSAYGPRPANRVAVVAMQPLPRVTQPEEDVALAKLLSLAATAASEGTKGGISGPDFSKAVTDFRKVLIARMDAVPMFAPLPPDVDIVMKALILWSRDPGNQWGEGVWDSQDLVMTAHDYATVPASQYKCNAYVAEVVYQSLGLVFRHISAADQPGKYFPFQAKEWHDPTVPIPHFPVVTIPKMGDIYATETHSGIFLGEYAGKLLYVSARDDPFGVFGSPSEQREHGIQIKVIPKAGVFRHYTP